jgi:7,8-dihydroneopterin aldolase/epimerase/oxygenase
MDQILISDLEVWYAVGVTEDERAKPQRLLLGIAMDRDLRMAASRDDLADTIDYQAVAQRLLHFGDDRHWQLIETIAADIAQMILEDYRPKAVTVEVKKFPIAQAQYVSVRITRP